MSVKRILSSFMAFIMLMLIVPQAAFAEEYVSLKDLANANGYEYFWYEDSETVNVRSASYILSFQNGNNMVGYKTVLDDQGTITLNYSAQLEGTDTLYVSKLDAQTKLIKYFPNTPNNSIDTDATDSSNSTGTPSDWAVSEINTAINNGLVTANVQKDYKADITREFFCELVMKLYEKITGESAAVGSNPFNDTNNTEVIKAYQLGIVNGVASNAFAPNSNITRQEICTMLVRAIGVMYTNIDLDDYTRHSFADAANIASWAMDSVQFAYDNDIMQGVGNNSIDPLGHATCEQAILLVNRIYENRQTFEDRNEKSEAVIETLQTLEFDDDSEVKSVSVSFADGSDTSDVRIREIDEDDLINTTTGIKGRAVNITSGKDFDKATISFEYNPNGLGGSDPNDLAVAWYNTDLERIEVLESQVNTSDHTVSIETTHFSEYVLVDSKEWYEVWQMGQTIVRETDANGNYAENFNVQLVMDCSGSMSGEMISRSQQVIYDFIGKLADDDKFSVIHFGDRASTVLSCSRKGDTDMEQVRQNVMTKQASGGTYYDNALQECRNNIDYDDPDYTSIIVFLTDGEPSNTDYDDLLNEFADHNVRIAAVGVETETQELKHLAEATNGQCLYAYSTESLDLLYASIQGSLMGVEATDTDGDGIPDVIEMTGMKTRYGTIIKTDPNKWDTDGDGLSDSEEMGKLINNGEPTEMDRAHGITQCVYYEYLSDPVEGTKINNLKAVVDYIPNTTDIQIDGKFTLQITLNVENASAQNVNIYIYDISECLDYDIADGMSYTFDNSIAKFDSLSIGTHVIELEMQCMNISKDGYCNDMHRIPISVSGSNFETVNITTYMDNPDYIDIVRFINEDRLELPLISSVDNTNIFNYNKYCYEYLNKYYIDNKTFMAILALDDPMMGINEVFDCIVNVYESEDFGKAYTKTNIAAALGEMINSITNEKSEVDDIISQDTKNMIKALKFGVDAAASYLPDNDKDFYDDVFDVLDKYVKFVGAVDTTVEKSINSYDQSMKYLEIFEKAIRKLDYIENYSNKGTNPLFWGTGKSTEIFENIYEAIKELKTEYTAWYVNKVQDIISQQGTNLIAALPEVQFVLFCIEMYNIQIGNAERADALKALYSTMLFDLPLSRAYNLYAKSIQSDEYTINEAKECAMIFDMCRATRLQAYKSAKQLDDLYYSFSHTWRQNNQRRQLENEILSADITYFENLSYQQE